MNQEALKSFNRKVEFMDMPTRQLEAKILRKEYQDITGRIYKEGQKVTIRKDLTSEPRPFAVPMEIAKYIGKRVTIEGVHPKSFSGWTIKECDDKNIIFYDEMFA